MRSKPSGQQKRSQLFEREAGMRCSGRRVGRWVLTVLTIAILADPVAAQSIGESFCQTALAQTLQNIFQLIQFGGPLIGGVIALGATVALPTIRRSDLKREIKELRTQGLIWGVIVAPLGTAIIQFLLSDVVAGGASCSF
ncbi:hypothetical protein DU500_05950 [Haloplanus rubicundus]|uniref:Uncharacterized protein n=1 Tax=Haloplanus rubicundus TaxID=1547898 RepID=A0A345E1F1_9EURY|nr:hypothetical protein [Haloplanus rubicundus]AXG06023.1 hypothetical protein DU500_05950 [Haloplanus rubicundus]